MNKITGIQKVIKDFSFLSTLPKEEIAFDVIKRIEKEGQGEMIKDFKLPCHIFVSFYKYEYNGRYHSQCLNVCIKDFANRSSSEVPKGLYIALETMKVEEKAWFNFRNKELHQVDNLSDKGCHFYVCVDDVRYKNCDTLESKINLSEELRKKAKVLFGEKQYEEALKKYRKEINISECLDKNKYSQEDIKEIKKINQKARINFLRCFGKLSHFDSATEELADSYSKELLKNGDDLSIVLRIKVLIQRKYLTAASEMAEELKKTNPEEAAIMIQQVNEKKKNPN